MEEQLASNQQAKGSSPLRGTIKTIGETTMVKLMIVVFMVSVAVGYQYYQWDLCMDMGFSKMYCLQHIY